MELDVEPDTISYPPDSRPIVLDVGEVDSLLSSSVAAGSTRGSIWLGIGPDSSTVFQWAPQFLQTISEHTLGRRLLGNLCQRFADGILMNTQYSGMGGAEMSLHTIIEAFSSTHGVAGQSIFWSGCDILVEARKVLRHDKAVCNPLHVFGDIMARVAPTLQELLEEVYSEAESQFNSLLGSTESPSDHQFNEIGHTMMQRMQHVLQSSAEHVPRTGWCYKCHGICNFFGPPTADLSMFRLVVAGSTCTSWSRMGKKRKWAARSAVAFMVWPYTTLWQQPHAIVHECTEGFDFDVLMLIFGALYVVSSFVFSPVDLGIPSSRARRYTILLLRSRCAPTLSYDLVGFGSLFFRHCLANGHMYWCAPECSLKRFSSQSAKKRGLPGTQGDGNSWPMREVLSMALLGKLLGYERLCARKQLPQQFIVNLLQSPWWHKILSNKTPCLMTKTSQLWSMVHQRLMLPTECLGVQGIPMFEVGRLLEHRFAVERLAMANKISPKTIAYLSGNGMHLAAVGAVLLFTLCNVDVIDTSAIPPSICYPSEPGEMEVEHEVDDDEFYH